MSTIHDLGEKVKGKVEQVEGELQEKGGRSIKGKLTKAKGKAREELADLNMDLRHEKNAVKHSWEDSYDDDI